MKRHSIFMACAALALVATPAWAQSSADASQAVAAGFGSTVALNGEQVFVGEPGNVFRPGRVYIYERDASGEWSEAAVLTNEAGEAADRFGGVLAFDGGNMLVSVNPRGDAPAGVAMFRRGESGDWSYAGALPHEVTEGDNFGAALALKGSQAFVGAPGGEDSAGRVYVYNRANGAWTQSDVLELEDGTGTGFGAAIAAGDGELLIGAPGSDSTEAHGPIAPNVHHYVWDAGAWTKSGDLGLNVVGERTGAASNLVMADDRLFVAAPGFGGGNGAVLVFERDEEGAWSQETALLPFEGATNLSGRRAFFGPRFGSSIAIDGGTVWVGAPGNAAVYSYSRDEDGWTGVSRVDLGGDEDSRGLGSALAMAGDLGVVGAGRASRGVGQAMIVERQAGQWTVAATLAPEPESLDPIVGSDVRCEDGQAADWSCEGMDLVSFLPVSAIGGGPGISLNDMWGWYDETTGKDYAIVGRTDGTSFIDVTDASNPRYLGDLPKTPEARISVWRDMKVYEDHVYIVSDGAGDHGVQVFDLTRLRDVTEPQTFEPDYLYTGIASAHNIVMNEETGFAYVVGASGGGETCGGGLHMLDLTDPGHPTFAGCFSDGVTGRRGTGYSHDAQCVTYTGPDEDYKGREICIGSNETALSFSDVTDKDNPISIATVEYPNVAYAHQGWLTPDQTLFFQNDEGDEPSGLVEHTRTLVWDVRDLDDPILVTEYFASTTETDHNLYIEGDLMYQSNYGAGLRVIDISDPDDIHEVGYFDTDPDLGCCGSWSNYPYFHNGAVGVTGGGAGFFLVKRQEDMVM